MNISIRQMEVFTAIVRHNNVSRAAEEIRLSQSAASMALAELERQLGEPLFDRVGRRLLLNDNGRSLFPKALDLLERVEDIETLFQGGGELHIGASSTIGNYLIPQLLRRFNEQHPNTRIVLQVGNTEQIIQALADCRIDLGYIEGPCHHPDLLIEVWRDDELIIFSATSHPLAQKPFITRSDLTSAEWVLREKGSGTREVFERALDGHLQNLNIRCELGNSEAVKRTVQQGGLLSCLSRLTVIDELAAGKLTELTVSHLMLPRKLYRVMRRGKYITHALQHFTDFMQSTADSE